MTVDARIHTAAELVARDEARRRSRSSDPVANVDAWLRSEIPRRLGRHHALWAELLAETPSLTASDLAQAVTSPELFMSDRNAVAMLDARSAIAERDMRRIEGRPPLCATCGDDYVLLDETNTARQCECVTRGTA